MLDDGPPSLRCRPRVPCDHNRTDGTLTRQAHSNEFCDLGGAFLYYMCRPRAPCGRSRTDGTLSH